MAKRGLLDEVQEANPDEVQAALEIALGDLKASRGTRPEPKKANWDDERLPTLTLGLTPTSAMRWEDEQWPLDKFFDQNGNPFAPTTTAHKNTPGTLESSEEIGAEYLVAGRVARVAFSEEMDYWEHDLGPMTQLLIRKITTRRSPQPRKSGSEWSRWEPEGG